MMAEITLPFWLGEVSAEVFCELLSGSDDHQCLESRGCCGRCMVRDLIGAIIHVATDIAQPLL